MNEVDISREDELSIVEDEQTERRRNLNEQLVLLLDEFSFAGCSNAMAKLGITHYNPFSRRADVPTPIELRSLAENLLRQVATMTGEDAEVHSGNLSAYRVGDNNFRLAFEVERVSTEDIIVPETTWKTY